MKKIKLVFITLLALIIIVPIIFFDYEKDKASEIDNRMLNELTDLKIDTIENYVSDRLGFRTSMVNIYNKINKNIFDVSTNSELLVGKDNNYLPNQFSTLEYGIYEEKLVNSIAQIQKYCEDRDIKFYYVLNPSKMSTYIELLPEGINYSTKPLEEYLEKCRENGINVIDNYEYLKSIKNEVNIYNDTHDVFHWNDTGAFYGINNILSSINKEFNEVSLNLNSEYDITENVHNGEIVKDYVSKIESNDLSGEYFEGLNINNEFNDFAYYTSDANDLTLLSFEGSFLFTNQRTEKFLSHRFGKTIAIHDYQNIFDIAYYVNIYEPDIVIFEMADYTFISYYFSEYSMELLDLNPVLKSLDYKEEDAGNLEYHLEEIGEYRNVIINLPKDTYDYAYLLADDKVYDLCAYDKEIVGLTTLISERIDYGEAVIKTYKKGEDIIKTYKLVLK